MSSIMYAREAVLLTHFRNRMRTMEEYPEVFEKVYTKIVETAMKGERFFSLPVSDSERAAYEYVVAYFSALGYAAWVPNDRLEVSWQ